MSSNLSRRGLFRAFRLADQVAPGAVATVSAAEAMTARIGPACVEPRGVMCRRCGDECDIRAISFRILGGGRSTPVLDADACSGCGACVPVCPVAAIDLIPAERSALAVGLAEMSRIP